MRPGNPTKLEKDDAQPNCGCRVSSTSEAIAPGLQGTGSSHDTSPPQHAGSWRSRIHVKRGCLCSPCPAGRPAAVACSAGRRPVERRCLRGLDCRDCRECRRDSGCSWMCSPGHHPASSARRSAIGSASRRRNRRSKDYWHLAAIARPGSDHRRRRATHFGKRQRERECGSDQSLLM
jgi:hypothetical protein